MAGAYGVFITSGQPWRAMSLALGPFVVADDGQLDPQPESRPALRFAWRGRRCAAELTEQGLRLFAIAARVPSTAEPGSDRGRAFRALGGLPAVLPEGWCFRLLADHRIQIEAEVPCSRPTTATSLVTAMVRFVLDLDPWLDRLEAEGIGLPAAIAA
jgi:hypothetical protein